MKTQATVERLNARTGSVVLRAEDGHYVLAQQVDAKTLHPAQALIGTWDAMGVEIATDHDSGAPYEFFIQAYGLSREAALQALI